MTQTQRNEIEASLAQHCNPILIITGVNAVPPHWLNLWPLTSYRWPVQCTQFQWLDTWKYRVIDLSRSPQKESSVTMAIHTGTLIVSHYTWWLSMWDRTLDTVIKMSNLERPVGTLLLSEFLSSPINRLCPTTFSWNACQSCEKDQNSHESSRPWLSRFKPKWPYLTKFISPTNFSASVCLLLKG